MTNLCIVRHAIAAERGPEWPDDNLRPLTAEGRARMSEAAKGLATMVQPAVILTSPLVRAVQTAEIVAKAFKRVDIRRCVALASGDHEGLADAAAAWSGDVIAVGHEPSISMAISWFLTADEDIAAFDVKKGSAHLLTFAGKPSPGTGVLAWSLPPRALREVGRVSGGR